MQTWLYNLPAPEMLIGAAVLAILLITATGLIAQRLPADDARTTAALDAYKIIVTFTAILLSFSLVQANGLVRTTEDAVSVEAGAMNQLDRIMLRSNTPATTAARPLLEHYIQAVIEADWPAMRRSSRSETARKRLGELNHAIQVLDTTSGNQALFSEMLKQLDQVNDSRQRRMDLIDVGLPPVLWQTIASLCLVLLILSAAVQMRARTLALGGHAIAIAVLMALTLLIDQPFMGDDSISPAPIERVLSQVQNRLQ